MQDLKQRGHEVYALAPNFDADLRSQLRAIGVESVDVALSRTGVNPFHDLRDIMQLWRVMRDVKPDLILAFTIKPVVYGIVVAAATGVARRYALITGLGYAFSANESVRDRLIQMIARLLYRVSLYGAHIVFMQNADDADEFVSRNIVSQNKISLINGTGVDLGDWPEMAAFHSPVTFTLAARLLGEKGIREYIEAARRVKSTHPDTRFLLLGSLDSNPSAIPEQEVRNWVAEGIVEWPGYVAMRPWLAQTSVFVLPSYREGVPRSTQEAMASGRAVITTDVPGCRETVIDGMNGYLVPPRNVEALEIAMLKFIENPLAIAEKGHRSRQLAEERFNVRNINARMISVMGA